MLLEQSFYTDVHYVGTCIKNWQHTKVPGKLLHLGPNSKTLCQKKASYKERLQSLEARFFLRFALRLELSAHVPAVNQPADWKAVSRRTLG